MNKNYELSDKNSPNRVWIIYFRSFAFMTIYFSYSFLWNFLMCIFNSEAYKWSDNFIYAAAMLVLYALIFFFICWIVVKRIDSKKLAIAMSIQAIIVFAVVLGFAYTLRIISPILFSPIIDWIIDLGWPLIIAKKFVYAWSWLIGLLTGWFFVGRSIWIHYSAQVKIIKSEMNHSA